MYRCESLCENLPELISFMNGTTGWAYWAGFSSAVTLFRFDAARMGVDGGRCFAAYRLPAFGFLARTVTLVGAALTSRQSPVMARSRSFLGVI